MSVIQVDSLTKNYLHFDLDKSCQLSNWKLRPLSRSQILYAASDALVLLRLFDVMTFEIQYSYLMFQSPSAACSPASSVCNNIENDNNKQHQQQHQIQNMNVETSYDSEVLKYICEDLTMMSTMNDDLKSSKNLSNSSESSASSGGNSNNQKNTSSDNHNIKEQVSGQHSSTPFSIYNYVTSYHYNKNTNAMNSSSSSSKKKRKQNMLQMSATATNSTSSINSSSNDTNTQD